ncbi:MAG: murein biosynthesis integral membrane protein MurJ, partial [Candidatus Omnitrophota bacterium]|nr:murein biosynthesis integral membrane protein MurJ [Candidatus Omnitrophota bacterium]
RDLIGEGATNAAIVPVLSEYSETKKKEEFWHLANVLLNAGLIVLAIVTLLGIVFAPFIVRLIAPGFIADPEKLRVTIDLTRVMFPYILLVGLLAYCMGILNSLRHFKAPAFAPAILNLSIITCALLRKGSVSALATGVLIGGVIQLLVQLPVLFSKGFRFNFSSGIYHVAVKKIGILLLPRILGSCVYQINIFVSTMLASFSHIVGSGGVAALYYASRIFQFPLAIFGIAIAQAALPTMSRQALQSGLEKFKETLSFSLRAVNFIMLPASLGLIVLAGPITRTLFERGAFGKYSTFITSNALIFYSIGLFSYAGIKILVSCFYSLKDTLSPVKVASVSLILNIVLNIIFMFPLKVGGLALATSLSGSFNFLILFILLRKKIGAIGGYAILKSFFRVLLASLAMALIIYFCAFKMGLNLFIVILIGILSYIAAAFIFNVKEARAFLRGAYTRDEH